MSWMKFELGIERVTNLAIERTVAHQSSETVFHDSDEDDTFTGAMPNRSSGRRNSVEIVLGQRQAGVGSVVGNRRGSFLEAAAIYG